MRVLDLPTSALRQFVNLLAFHNFADVVYLTGYSTSYPDMEDTLEEEESETGDWEPYDTGELLMNASNDETVGEFGNLD